MKSRGRSWAEQPARFSRTLPAGKPTSPPRLAPGEPFSWRTDSQRSPPTCRATWQPRTWRRRLRPVRKLALVFSVVNREVRKGGPHGGAEGWEAVQRLLLESQTTAGVDPRGQRGLEVDPAEVVTAYCGGWRGPGRSLETRNANQEATAALLWVVT